MNSQNENKCVSNQDLKKIELQILEYIVDVCNKEDIPIFLTYGSLLGAVRHSGFIPWDDDIDLMVTRDFFQKLINAVNKHKNNRFKFISLQTDKKYIFPLAKVYDTTTILYEDYGAIQTEPFGVNIDIFILDNLPDDRKQEESFFFKGNRMRRNFGFAIRKYEISKKHFIRSLIRNLIITPYRIAGYRYFAEKYEAFCQKYNSFKTKNVGIIQFGEGSGNKERIPRECLTGNTKLLFEGKEYSVPDNYIDYLTQLYGDYMTLPPEGKRVTKHNFKAYWK